MTERTSIIASRISLIGTFLILLNSIIVALNGSPLIFSSYPVSSIDDLLKPNNPLWISIVFGFRRAVQGPLTIVWIIIGAINFFIAVLWNLKQKGPNIKASTILVLSLLGIFTGGGFIIGLILSLIGACLGLQSKLPLHETFVIRYLRALRLDKAIFNNLKRGTDMDAVWRITLVSFLSGFGCSYYVNMLNEIRLSSDKALKILLLGEQFWSNSVLFWAFINIGTGVLKWLLLTLIIFLIGTKLMAKKASFDAVMSMISYAYLPISLQIFLPLLHFNEPALSINWPMTVFFITNLWTIIALVIGAQQIFEITKKKALGLVMLSGTIYWIAIYKLILPAFRTIESGFQAPGIFFEIQPLNVVLFLTSVSVILSALLGVFSKK